MTAAGQQAIGDLVPALAAVAAARRLVLSHVQVDLATLQLNQVHPKAVQTVQHARNVTVLLTQSQVTILTYAGAQAAIVKDTIQNLSAMVDLPLLAIKEILTWDGQVHSRSLATTVDMLKGLVLAHVM